MLDHPATEHFTHRGGAMYTLCGTALGIYGDARRRQAVALEAAGFRCYFRPTAPVTFRPAARLLGRGLLALDSALRAARLSHRAGVPDRFHALVIARISKVRIPEAFIARHPTGIGYPASLPAEGYAPTDVAEVSTTAERPGEAAIFLLDCGAAGLDEGHIPQTFVR